MSQPILYLFAISHYCEKARWALDHFGIAYQPRYVIPGVNRVIAKKIGASSGSLPFMHAGDDVVAGSSAIIDWGEGHRDQSRPSLAGEDAAAIRALEQRLDDVLGVHVRRFYYSDALINDPASVRPIFSRDLPLIPKLAVTLGWSKIVPRMITLMDLGPAQGLASRDIILGEVDWLDALLGDGRAYLMGGTLTRADITAASLLAPFIQPPQHPAYANLTLPPALAATVAPWRDRPTFQWVARIYATCR